MVFVDVKQRIYLLTYLLTYLLIGPGFISSGTKLALVYIQDKLTLHIIPNMLFSI